MPTRSNRDIVEDYFSSWKNHNTELLDGITAASIQYEIVNKDEINDKAWLVEYWQRNADRQKELSVQHFVTRDNYRSVSTQFIAQFTDVEKSERQTVYGQIVFHIDIASGLISRIVENYDVVRSSLRQYFFSGILDGASIRNQAARGLSRLWDFTKKAAKLFLAILVMLFIFVGFVIWFGKPDNQIIMFLLKTNLGGALVASPGDQLRSINDLRSSHAYIIGVIGIVFPVVSVFSSKILGPEGLKVFPTGEVEQDIRIMKRYMKNADEIDIFSGDFDFLSTDPELLTILTNVSVRNRLQLISSASRDQVRANQTSDSIHFLNQLELRFQIHYDSGMDIKSSFIKTGGTSVLLYRHIEFLSGRDQPEICVLSQKSRLRPVVQYIHQLIKDSIKNRVDKEPNDYTRFLSSNATIAVVLAGEPKSGKSELARKMAGDGFEIISASGVLGKQIEGEVSRAKLLDKGSGFLSEQDQIRFGEILVDQSRDLPRVIFDGVRLGGAIEELRRSFSRVLLVYIQTEDHVREHRFEQADDRSLSFQELCDHPVEQIGKKLRIEADLVVSGEADTSANLEKIMFSLYARMS